jgi:hypothetical protein
MRRALAIRCAEARNDDTSLRQLHRRVRPIALATRHAFGHPHLDHANRLDTQHIIHVPVETLFGAQVTLDPRSKSTRAERTANVEIKTGGEAESPSPAKANDA